MNKFSIATLAALVLAFSSSSVEAFSSSHASLSSSLSSSSSTAFRRPVTTLASTPPSSDSSSSSDKVAALRAAAAKARADADRLNQELGKITPTQTKALPKKSADELKSLLPSLIKSDVSEQTAAWKDLKESGAVTAFGSAALRTFPVSLQMLEQRTGLTPDSLGLEDSDVSLEDFKYATVAVLGGSTVAGVLSLAFLPPNVGATACYFFALLPLLFLGLGSSVPGIIAGAIVTLKGNKDSSGASPEERVCRHEAAHFCCGYWCGLPVQGYSVDQGVARVEFGVRNQQLDSNEVAALSVTALAGLVGEATKWEKAVGAANDLLQLEQVFRKSEAFMGSKAQQDVTRWGALTATTLLKQNAKQYELVVEAFKRQAPLEDCIAILES